MRRRKQQTRQHKEHLMERSHVGCRRRVTGLSALPSTDATVTACCRAPFRNPDTTPGSEHTKTRQNSSSLVYRVSTAARKRGRDTHFFYGPLRILVRPWLTWRKSFIRRVRGPLTRHFRRSLPRIFSLDTGRNLILWVRVQLLTQFIIGYFGA